MERSLDKGAGSDGEDCSPGPGPRGSAGHQQIHLRLPNEDAAFLRQLATERSQTLSGAVRHLLNAVRRGRR